MTGQGTLFGGNAPPHTPGRMRAEVEATISALDALELLTDRHRGLCQLARTLADAVEAGVRYGKAAATAMAARELRETLAMLPEPDDVVSDEFADLVDALRRAEMGDAAQHLTQ